MTRRAVIRRRIVRLVEYFLFCIGAAFAIIGFMAVVIIAGCL